VRDRLLALLGELLTQNGVAFVSYNALPGAHFRTMIREMMLYRAEGIEDPKQRVTEAIEFLRIVVAARPEGDPYRMLVEEQLERMEKRSPEVTYHDEMTGAYHPVQFIEFAEGAQRHGLQYLSESTLPRSTDPCYLPAVRRAIENVAGGDILKQEQMLDFARIRMYRETLLCRAEQVVRRDFPVEHVRRLLLASQARSAPGETPGAKIFTLPSGVKMESNHPAVIALLEVLEAASPRVLSFDEIEPRIAGSGFALDGDGVNVVMRLAAANMIELHAWRPPVAEGIAARPLASGCSRQEALTRMYATTLMHGTVGLDDPVLRSFLKLLDGTRDRAALLDAMKGEFPGMGTEELERGIEPSLRIFHRAGLLEA
jgi:hypothetical protein